MSPLARAARQSTCFSHTAARAASSQAGPSKPPAPASAKSKQPRRLPKPVLRDLVKLHHTSSTFMHDPYQLHDAFEAAFRAASPDHLPYAFFLDAAGARGQSSQRADAHKADYYEKLSRAADQPCPTFGKTKSSWSDKGLIDDSQEPTERQKQLREALFGTWERGPGESVRPGLEGIEEWLDASGTSVQQVARDWDDRHNEVVTGNARGPTHETEDGQ